MVPTATEAYSTDIFKVTFLAGEMGYVLVSGDSDTDLRDRGPVQIGLGELRALGGAVSVSWSLPARAASFAEDASAMTNWLATAAQLAWPFQVP